ncbi:MAG: hypothetical protein E7302_13470 [Butyrivibrio sp.]|nr:hypothetical protein [Butyrivibrio sp.]
MSDNMKDISYLLNPNKYANDSDFIVACYECLFERAPGIDELFDAITLISNGLPRKIYFYNLLISPEFGNRFQVVDYDNYINELNIYNTPPAPVEPEEPEIVEETADGRISSVLSRLFKRFTPHNTEESSSPAVESEEIIDTSNLNDTEEHAECPDPCDTSYHFDFAFIKQDNAPVSLVPDEDSEFSALSNCQIDTLRQYLEGNYKSTNTCHIGEFAKHLLPASVNGISSPTDNLLITSPSYIGSFFKNGCFSSVTKAVADSLLFTMPVLPDSDKPVAVVWDKHWRAFNPIGRHFERYSTGPASAGIYFINNADDTLKVHLSFDLICYKTSSVIISFGSVSYEVNLNKPSTEVSVSLYLLPGLNIMNLSFIGTPYVSASTGGEPVRFSVRNMTVSIDGDPFVLDKADAYKHDTMTLGDGYYQYIYTDRHIRFMLHENGFFEVSSVRFFNDYSIVTEDTTRYLEYRYGDLDTNYQIHKKAPDAAIDASRASVRLYIAKRTGKI